MMESAKERYGNNVTSITVFNVVSRRRVFIQTQVCPMLVIIVQVFFQHPAQVPFVQDYNLIKAFPTDGPDHTFYVRILPRRRWRRDDIVDPQCSNSPFYG
jgi:hypothetical protein